VVTQRTSSPAQRSLCSLIGREGQFSPWYDRTMQSLLRGQAMFRYNLPHCTWVQVKRHSLTQRRWQRMLRLTSMALNSYDADSLPTPRRWAGMLAQFALVLSCRMAFSCVTGSVIHVWSGGQQPLHHAAMHAGNASATTKTSALQAGAVWAHPCQLPGCSGLPGGAQHL
jgi:hypothetical protein